MPLDFKLSVYLCFMIISSIQMALAGSHYDTAHSKNDNNQATATDEHLEEAFEEQVSTFKQTELTQMHASLSGNNNLTH